MMQGVPPLGGVLMLRPLSPTRDQDTYTTVHSSGFREFLLKPELLRAIGDCGFEHPSEGEPTSLSTAATATS